MNKKITFFLLNLITLLNLGFSCNFPNNTQTEILINNRFAMLISKNCDQTLFIDTTKKNYMNGLEYLVNEIKDLELVTSYSKNYNYSNNHQIEYVINHVSTNNFRCHTEYPLNNYIPPKNNKQSSYFEIGFFIIFIILFPLFALYHFFKLLWRCLCHVCTNYRWI